MNSYAVKWIRFGESFEPITEGVLIVTASSTYTAELSVSRALPDIGSCEAELLVENV